MNHKHIKTVFTGSINREEGTGCGECQTSCQSACKTSCTVSSQSCERPQGAAPPRVKVPVSL